MEPGPLAFRRSTWHYFPSGVGRQFVGLGKADYRRRRPTGSASPQGRTAIGLWFRPRAADNTVDPAAGRRRVITCSTRQPTPSTPGPSKTS